jgi:hemoglobin-like flavoprotein
MAIEESVQRLLAEKETVVRLFYERFLAEDPRVRQYFVDTDLEQQAIVVTTALVMVESYFSHAYPAARLYLKVLGHRHHLRQIPADLYPKFCECLLKTLAEFHQDDWNVELSTEWRDALEIASRAMLEGYKRPYVY